MSNTRKVVLIVDDLKPNRTLLRYQLSKAGYDSIDADSGAKAIELLERESIDLVLLDAMMPNMNGFEVLERIRRMPKSKFIPVLMVTALGASSDKIKALESGADDFITRPHSEEELFAKLRAIFKMQDEYRYLEQQKTDLTSMLVHDMRSPLTSILGMLDLVLIGAVGPLNETQQDYLQTARSNSEKLLNIVNNFLDLSKLESGTLHLEKSWYRMSEIARNPVTNLKVMAEQKGIRIEDRLSKEATSLHVDAELLEQVLNNLFDNALKFTSANGHIALGCMKSDKELTIYIKDTGQGIPEEDLTYIFEKYKQVGLRSKGGQKGTGLGLAVSKLIIEAHGGEIWAESELGKGSSFYIQLPLES